MRRRRPRVRAVESGLFSRSFCAPTRLEIRSNALSSSTRVFRELSSARIDDGLNLLLRLLTDWNVTVEVLVHEEANEHLKQRELHTTNLREDFFPHAYVERFELFRVVSFDLFLAVVVFIVVIFVFGAI